MTKLQINALAMAVMLFILQVLILVGLFLLAEGNGFIVNELLKAPHEIGEAALIGGLFSPMGGMVWTLKHFAGAADIPRSNNDHAQK